MILAAGLLFGAFLLAWLAPPTLNRLAMNGRDPSLALMSWLLTIVAVVGTGTAGVVLLLASGDRQHGVGDWIHACAFFGHRHLHPWDELLGSALLATLMVIGWRAGGSAMRRLQALRRTHRAHLTLVQTRAVEASDGVLWLDHHAPFAYSVGGRPGLIVAAQAVRKLPEDTASAILRHERHHLHRRHHLIIIAVHAIRDAMPRVPLFRHAPAAVAVLTELTADATAARSYGPGAVRRALSTLDKDDVDRTLRLRRLSHAHTKPGPAMLLARTAAGVTSALVPSAFGVAALFIVIEVACQIH